MPIRRRSRSPDSPRRGGGYRGGGRAGGKGADNPGDWLCDACDAHNFARRDACFKCQKPWNARAPRPVLPPVPARRPSPRTNGVRRTFATERDLRPFRMESDVRECNAETLAARIIEWCNSASKQVDCGDWRVTDVKEVNCHSCLQVSAAFSWAGPDGCQGDDCRTFSFTARGGRLRCVSCGDFQSGTRAAAG
eukprot:TRINITY_DN8178_c0_g1_i1.p2 TRINITY_DN8178_c0_g1~~TRINITY_DN8178_c0_g1_i1.p2  ORF type:complete len:217 (+),score=54.81 TRINITY_DN8178_c0_g1_i1:73-651(+)